MLNDLIGECDLRHQHDRGFVQLQTFVDRFHVNFRLAAGCHAMQQKISCLDAAIASLMRARQRPSAPRSAPPDVHLARQVLRFLCLALSRRFSLDTETADRVRIGNGVALLHPRGCFHHFPIERAGSVNTFDFPLFFLLRATDMFRKRKDKAPPSSCLSPAERNPDLIADPKVCLIRRAIGKKLSVCLLLFSTTTSRYFMRACPFLCSIASFHILQ